jgi:hypothetical protein
MVTFPKDKTNLQQILHQPHMLRHIVEQNVWNFRHRFGLVQLGLGPTNRDVFVVLGYLYRGVVDAVAVQRRDFTRPDGIFEAGAWQRWEELGEENLLDRFVGGVVAVLVLKYKVS